LIAQEIQYREWMLAALAGDQSAYRILLGSLTQHLRSYYARRLSPTAAEDAMQEALIAIHTRRATYDPAQPFTAWVYGIARYKLLDVHRRARRSKTVPLDDAGELFAADEFEAASAKCDVEKMLATLPEAKRKLLREVKLDGRSISEMAAETGMSGGSVKVAIHRVLKSLRDGFGGGGAD
jgi:RNA polymerase sigma-70 factor (ECF subfamily)